MQKRGQITAFVAVGIIIFAVIGLAVYISQVSTSSKKPVPFEIVPYDVQNVEKYVTSCLDEAIKEAVSYCSGNFPTGEPKCPDYELNIENRLLENFCICIPECKDFSIFKNLEIELKGDPQPKAILTKDKKILRVMMEFPILIKKGESQYLFGTADSPFFTQHELEQSSCIIIKLKNNDYALCEADEEKITEVLGISFHFHVGDKVIIGGRCIAC